MGVSHFWKNQEDWEIVRWRLNESSGVHTLELEDGTMIHMLTERRYPLSRELMIRMLDHGMEVEDESDIAITLIHLFILWTTEDVHHGLLPFLGTKELTSPRVNGYLIQECKMQEVRALDASSGNIESSRIVSDKWSAKSLENDCNETKDLIKAQGMKIHLGLTSSRSGNELQ
ncbi:hypothetical protein Tco_0099842 [Tanacetum coccineum]